MASLSRCLAEAAEFMRAGDRDAISSRARVLKKGGMTTAEAARKAVLDILEGSRRDREITDAALTASTKPRKSDAEIGKRLEARLKDHDKAVKAYEALEDSQGGKILNTDTARELSRHYLMDRTRSAAVHEPASAFIKRLYAQKLKEAPKPGELPLVLFTAGGTGAGKSSAIAGLRGVQAIADRAQIIYDTNMNKTASAVDKIEAALAADKAVQIVLVARDPVDALRAGALPRAERQAKRFGTGRTVPIEEHIKTHVGALKTIKELAQKYADDPRVDIRIIDNSLGKGNARERDAAWLAKLEYTDVERQVRSALEAEREAGTISEATYRGFAGEGGASARGEGADRGVSSPDRPGVRQGAEQAGDQSLAQGDRGAFSPQTNVLALFKGANLSTFLHESGHFYLEVYADVAMRGVSPQVTADMGVILQWFGVKDLATWQSMTLEQKRPYHEKLARTFETYLMEGKAPNAELRPMFARFRSWLLNIYRSVQALGGDITPDVRGVFDRMLASADSIREAEQQARYEPLFRTAKEAGMTDAEFAQYMAIGQQATDGALDTMQARSLRDMKWLSGAKSRALRDLQMQAETQRRAITEEVTREMQSNQAFAAAEMLRARKGADPEVVAELNRFDSADAMMQAILDAGDIKDVIKAETDRRMLERHGDLIDPRSIEDAANAAVHNEARSRFLATGLKLLTKSPLPVRAIVKAAQEMAERMIGGKMIRELDPHSYLRAESRANRDAVAAAAKDPAKAIEAQRAAIMNNRLARTALEARAEVEKGLEHLRKLEREPPSIDRDYMDQIVGLLQRYELGGTLKRADSMTSLRDWMARLEEDGIVPDIPPELMAEANRKNYRDMTVEEFRGLVDTVRQIEHLGRLKHKLLTAEDARDFAGARDDLVASVVANSRGRQADTRSSNTVLGQSWEKVKGFWADHIKASTWARIMDGGKDGGPMWERLIRPANDAANRETQMRAQATKDLMRLLEPVRKQGHLGGKGEFFKSIGRSLNREARLAWAMNMGNAGNMQRLLDGNGYTRAQIQPVLDTLTAADWQFVQGVWDYMESYRPMIAEKERRVMGKEPDWVDPTPLQVKTADGETLNLRGGYYPIKYDPRASARAETFATAEDVAQQMKGAFTSSTTRRSFTKTRAEEVKGCPLMESLDGIYGGVQEVIHDLAWHEYLIDANRLLRDDALSSTIRSTYGPEVHQQFKNWIQDVAVGEAAARQAGEQAMRWIRQGVSISGLGFNLMTAAIQPLGFTQSIVRIGPEYVSRGIAKAMGSPVETTARISEMSSFMANRFLTRNRELNEVRNQVQGQGKIRRAIDTGAYMFMLRAQQLVDIPTWWGAYEKATAQGNDQARASALADQAVIDSQGGGQTKDQSAIERGGPFQKLFTTFYAYFNTALNLGVQRTMTADSKARLVADYALLYVVPAILGAALKDALTPGDADDWEPEKVLRKVAGEQLNYLTGLMFGLRDIGGFMANVVKGEGFGTDYTGPAGLRMFQDLSKLTKQVAQGEWDVALTKALASFTGDLLRLPGSQINRTITGIDALAEGKTSNPLALAFGYQEPR